jgi:hypothetical protein
MQSLNSPDADLCGLIRRGDPNAEEHLRHLYSEGIRFQLRRRTGSQNVEERTRRILTMIVGRIRDGWNPGANDILTFLAEQVPVERPPFVEHHRRIQEKAEALTPVLRGRTPREIEMLMRYYTHGQDLYQVVTQMRVSREELKSLKARLRGVAMTSPLGLSSLTQVACQ